MYDYDWPGNVRELENTLERCMILSDGDQVEVDSLPANMLHNLKLCFGNNAVMFSEDSPVIPFEN